MTPYSPMSRSERVATAITSTTISLSLLASLLVLFNDGRLPFVGAPDEPVLAGARCATVGTVGASCITPMDTSTPRHAVAERRAEGSVHEQAVE